MSETIAEAYVQIIPTAKGIKGSLENELNGEVESAGKSAGSKLGSVLGTASKVGLAAVGAASAAVGSLVKQSTESYAQYEQLVGGVETLFKGSSDAVLANADVAFKTAGMTANEYMETVTSFSASLLQSLGGDTQKAAESADMAIRDMSDNANKMGTDMEAIQNAYNGFAKQNYTMLDNLKLGYGGTKQEMERLLADAEAFSGIQYDINSLSDVYDAIHVVQTELGITGTTALEASSTISGSVDSMKSAWGNLVTGIADDDANIDQLISNLVDSAITVGDNLLPVAEQALNGIAEMIEKVAPIIAEKLPTLLENSLPKIIESGVKLITALATGLAKALPSLVKMAPQIIMSIVNGLLQVRGELLNAGKDIVSGIWNGIQNKWTDLKNKVADLAKGLVDSIQNVFKIGSPSKIMRDEVGQWIPEGIAVGIEATADSPVKALDSVANEINGSVQNKLSTNYAVTSNPNMYDSVATSESSNVASLLAEYLPLLANIGNTNITLEGDAKNMFNVVRKQNSMYKRATGVSAFT